LTQILGAVKSAVKIYHLQWRVKSQPDSAFGIFSSIPSAQGYPVGGSDLATAFESDCDVIWYDLLQDNAPSLGFILITLQGAGFKALIYSSNNITGCIHTNV